MNPEPHKRQLLAAVISAAFAHSALAQTAAPPAASPAQGSSDPVSLESITVTATKRTQLLTDVPQSVQAITGETLRGQGVESVSDVVQVVPGASQTLKAAPGFEVLQLRGISSGAVGDPLVGYYIDEIPFALPNTQYIPPVNVFDLSRVEVLRGPQGTLYGQSSMGGAFKLITRKPDLEKFGGEVRVGASRVDGGHDGTKAEFMLNLPVRKETFGLRLTGGTSEEESFIANAGKIRNHNVRVKALANVNSDLSVEGTLWSVRSRQSDYAYGQLVDPLTLLPPGNAYAGITDPAQPRGVKTDATIANVTINYATPVGDLVSATSYLDHELDFRYSLPLLNALGALNGVGTWASQNNLATKVWTQEVRLTSIPGGDISWIGGVFLQDAKVATSQQQGYPLLAPLGLGPAFYTDASGRLTSRSLGVFGELSRDFIGGKLTPTFGLRYFRDKREGADHIDGVPGNAERTFSSLNPRFNLAYKPVAGQLYYANVAKGFRSGAFQAQSAVNAAAGLGLPAQRLMPEDKLWSYELGSKLELGRTVAVEAAIYQIDWKDAQLTNLVANAVGVATTVITGGVDIRGRGLDLGLTWATPVPGLSFQIGGNINATEFTRAPASGAARVGAQIPGSPRKSTVLQANYRTTVGGLRLTTNLTYAYRAAQGELTTGLESDLIRDLRTRVTIGGNNWDASVFATNLKNQKGVAAVVNSAAVNPIQPRKVGVELAYRF